MRQRGVCKGVYAIRRTDMQADNCRGKLYSPNIFYICKCHTYGAKLWEFWVVTLRVRDEKYGTFSGYVAESSRRRRSLESLAFPTRVGAIPRLESATSSTRVGDAAESSRETTKKRARKHCFQALWLYQSLIAFLL